MCSMASVVLCFTFFNLFVFVQCGLQSPAEDTYGIVATEWAIRDTLNNLFSTLKLKVMQQKLKLKQYSKIHNFFVSITLRDHDNLKKIAKLTAVENIDNGTRVFITQLNEAFDEDNKTDVATDSVYVEILIEEFVDKLDNLKETNEVLNNTKFDLNKAILRYFSKHENEFGNTTYLKKGHYKGNDSDYNVLDSIESWLPSGRRIFEGIKSSIKRFPFMASVQFFKKFQCGGSIIKSDLVITSASCLQIAYNNRFFRENPAFLSVQVGSSLYERGGDNVPILEINFHPNYNPKNLRHNLAIMRLTRTLRFTRGGKKIKKINFDKNPWTLPPNTDGIIIVGWGARAIGTSVVNLWKNELSYSTLDFYPLAECQEIYTKEFVTDHHFCAGFFSKGGGACNHDAGGPGVLTGILVGVISFGAPMCGTPDAPTVFTKLGYYTDWIEEIMETKTLQGSQPTTQRTVSYLKYGLPSFTKTTPFRVTPIVSTFGKKDKRYDRLRTNDKKHEFKDFLKTMFKKKKQDDVPEEEEDEKEPEDIPNQEEEGGLEDLLEQEVKLELADVKQQEDEQKQENVQEQEDLEDVEEQEIEQEEVEKKVSEQEHTKEETEEISKSESRDKAQYLKEVNKSKLNLAIRYKSERKPSINKPKSTPQTVESESQSNENSVENSAAFEINKAQVTALLGDYDANTPTTPSFNPRNDENINTSASQETDIDDAIESLIDDLNLSFILESKNSSSKNQQQMRARDKLQNDTVLNTKGEKPRSVVENKNRDAKQDQSDAHDRRDKENSNEKGEPNEDFDEDQASNLNEEMNEQNVYDFKNDNKAIHRPSSDNVDNHSNDNDKTEISEDGNDEVDDGGETDDETETFSIPAEVQDSNNSTEKLLEMLEYEDLYKLLMKDSERLT